MRNPTGNLRLCKYKPAYVAASFLRGLHYMQRRSTAGKYWSSQSIVIAMRIRIFGTLRFSD